MKARLKQWLTTRVWCGPLAGMRYVETAHGSSLLPKVAGTYELEIQPETVDRIRAARRRIVDLGAAEGYYAVGSLVLNPAIRSVAYESTAAARAVCLEMAQRNQVADRLQIKGHCSVADLRQELAANDVDLLIVDIEGGELEVLDPVQIPALADVPIIVELHDVFIPGLKEQLRQRFEPTHSIREFTARERTVQDLKAPWLRWSAALSAPFADRLLNERRPPGMSWYLLEPFRASATAGAAGTTPPNP
jgi:hypothetical protein